MTPVVLYDACVLYPFFLHDLLVRLAMTDLVRAHWTDAIHDEWTRNLAANDGIPAERLQRTRELMDRAVPGALVTDYEAWIPKLTLPDPDDRHVLAAALECGADLIVTHNLSDFPKSVLDTQFAIQPCSPDELLAPMIVEDRDVVLAFLREQRAAYLNPPMNGEAFLSAMERAGLRASVGLLRPFLADI